MPEERSENDSGIAAPHLLNPDVPPRTVAGKTARTSNESIIDFLYGEFF